MDLLLFLFVWLGHACLWLLILNLLYSQPLHKTFLKISRLVIALVIFIFPPMFLFYVTSWDRILKWNWTIHFSIFEGISPVLYLLLCLAISCIGLPWVTITRLRRKVPDQVLEERTEQLDIEKELGYRPAGDGKYHRWAQFSINQLFTVDFTTLTLAPDDLPAQWDGLTILHLSDLHFIGTPAKEYFDRIMQKCMADGVPDLVMITGDIIDTNKHHEWILPILGQLKWNIAGFVILGNHDWWQDSETVRKIFREMGFHEVGNRWEQIEVKGHPLTVIGHEGPWFRPAPDMASCPQEGFRICLSHSPDNIHWCRKYRVPLMLSGHNHGGQIRIPIFGSLFVPSKYSRRYDMGTFYRAPTLLHVNRGLSGKEPLRFRCNPQVTRIILKRKEIRG
jgi:uncharacterized protein